MKMGWIGLGNMGLAMARNTLKAGHELVVYNRTRSRAEELRPDGAKVADSPAAAATQPVLVTMLADDPAVEDVILGAGKVLESLPPGSTHVSMSTISVALSKRLVEAHRKAGQSYVAAPVFGRPEAAAAARLAVIAGGPAGAVTRCQPLFDAVGQRTYLAGEDAPQANVIKLAGNFLIAATIETLAEAFALVRKYGIDPHQYLDILLGSQFAAVIYKTYGTLVADDKYQPVGFRLPLGLKDVRLVLAAADGAAVPMPLASLVRDRLISAVARGMQDQDWAAFARFAAEDAGLKPGGTSERAR